MMGEDKIFLACGLLKTSTVKFLFHFHKNYTGHNMFIVNCSVKCEDLTCLNLTVSNHIFDTLSPLTLMCQTCSFISAIPSRGKC